MSSSRKAIRATTFRLHPARRESSSRCSLRSAKSRRRDVGAGDFFGEGALAGADSVPHRDGDGGVTTSVLIIEKEAMIRLLHDEPAFSDRFISYMLTRNMRIEADLVDQLFNSSEKRSPARCCCWRATAGQSRSARCRRSRRRRWRK
jgi:hypothetical protein